MKEKNQVQGMMGGKTLTWVGIIAVIFLALLSLGGLLYAFLVPVP